MEPLQGGPCNVGSPPTPAGSPTFFGESRGKEHQGQAPGPRVLWPLVATRWFLGWLPLIRSKGYYFRCAKTDLGRIFEKKYAEKHFCERKSPNQGTYMGYEIAPPSEQCGTTAKTSEWERAAPNPGGAGGHPPRLFASGLSLEKAWIPARDRAGNHVAGSTLRRSRRDSLPMTEGTHLAGANLRWSKTGPPAVAGNIPHPQMGPGYSSPSARVVY